MFRDLDKLRELLRFYMRGHSTKHSSKVEGSPGKRNKDLLRKAGSTTSILSEIAEEKGEAPAIVEEEKKSSKSSGPHYNNIRTSHFIIQKYIETPLLLRRRKFDIRVWVLLNQNSDLFFFKEGYLRTSGSPF